MQETYGVVGGGVCEFFAHELVHPFGLLVVSARVDAGDDERHVLVMVGRVLGLDLVGFEGGGG